MRPRIVHRFDGIDGTTTMEKIIILYSNPPGTNRLRLDKEHRAIDELLASLALPSDTVVRRHATTLEDLTTAIADKDYTVFHFSGHGSPAGILLEGTSGKPGELLEASRLVTILHEAQPNLKLAVFMCCFSADAIPILTRAASYLLTVFGPLDDEAAIEFTRGFYKHYLKLGSIEKATFLSQFQSDNKIKAVLSRRRLNTTDDQVLLEVFPSGNHAGDSFLIDLSRAEKDIQRLDATRENFLEVLSRKIRLHSRIFDSPREKAIVPVGKYVGVFSWKNATDVIICYRVLQVKIEIEQETSDAWAKLAVEYNERHNGIEC